MVRIDYAFILKQFIPKTSMQKTLDLFKKR